MVSFVLHLAALLSFATSLVAFAAPPDSCEAWQALSVAATSRFVERFVWGSEGRFWDWSNRSAADSGGWNAYMAIHAVADASTFRRPWLVSFMRNVSAFYAQQGGWTTEFYDDGNWAVEALVRVASSLPAEEKDLRDQLLQSAEAVANYTAAAWDTTCCGAKPGGYWWNVAHTYKATASNAGTAVAMCKLHWATGNRRWLEEAKKAFTFWNDNYVNKTTGQVCDGVDAKTGTWHWDVYSYNQGMMLGAAACLYKVTKDQSYLNGVENIVKFVLRNETNPSTGVLFEHADGSPCKSNDRDCLEFLGITFRFLLDYYVQMEDDAVLKVLESSIHSLLAFTSDGGTTFPLSWTGPKLPPGTVTDLPSQTSGLSALLRWTAYKCNWMSFFM